MLVNNVDEALLHLENIIQDAKAKSSRIGFFAAVYRQVTARVKQGIEDYFFDDGPRMDAYTTRFANRYFEALDNYLSGQQTNRAWEIAFRSIGNEKLLVVQHILLGMNAHINLDLAIATAEVIVDSIADIQADFNRINDILADELEKVQMKIGRFSPLLNVLDIVGGRKDEILINFSISKARQAAWDKANLLIALSSHQRQAAIDTLDKDVALIGGFVAKPKGILGKALAFISWAESNDVMAVIEALR